MNQDEFRGIGGSYVKIDGKRVRAADAAKLAAAGTTAKKAPAEAEAKTASQKKSTGSDA